MYTPFVPNMATSQQTTQTESSSDGPTKITGTMTAEIVKVLQENGIPNDVDMFLKQADTFLARSQSLGSLSIFGGSDQKEYDVSDMVRIQSLANKVRFNKQLYDAAAKQLTDQNAWSEVALDDQGRMYVYSEDNGIETISPNQFHSNPEAYAPLTNSQLMALRENQPQFSFNQDILNNVSNSVGMESIIDHVKGIVKDFGTTTIEGYTAKNRDSIEAGFRELLMNGPDGYYKYKNTDQLNRGDRNNIEMALNYLYSSLPNNMKQLLRAKTAAEGGDPKSMDTHELLLLALTAHTSNSRSVDFDSAATNAGGKGSGSESESMIQTSYTTRVATGQDLPEEQWVSILPQGSRAELFASAQDVGPMVKKNGERVEQNNLQVLMREVEAFNVADMRSVTFGDNLVGSGDLNKILWDDASNLTRVWLPYDNVDGKITPNFQLQKIVDELSEYLSDHVLTPMEINDRIQRAFTGTALEGYVKYDSTTGNVQVSKEAMMPFLSFSAYAGDDSLDFNTKSPYLEKVSTDEGYKLTNMYDNFMWYGTQTPAKGQAKTRDTRSTHRDFYKGNVFIPIQSGVMGAHMGGDSYAPKSNFVNITQQSQLQRSQRAGYDRIISTSNALD